MEVVLVRFVGAGTAAALSGLSHCIPHACIGEGLALVTELSRERPPALMPLIDTVARDVCRGWRGARIPDPIAVQHLEVTARHPAGAWSFCRQVDPSFNRHRQDAPRSQAR